MTSEKKDWSWVLERACPECHLDTRGIAREEIPALLRANAADWQRALTTADRPAVFANWDGDEAVVRGRYGEQPADRIAAELAAAAATAAGRLQRIGTGQWQRTGRRSDGAKYTVETFGRNLVHEAVHHLYDVTGIPSGG